MSIHVQRYAFDRIFTEAERGSPEHARADVALEIAALRAEIAALQAGHEDALAMARADAFEAGLAQARGEQNVAVLSAVDALQAGIEALDTRFADVADRVTGEAAEVALAAAELLAGHELRAAPAAAIDEAIGRALRQVARGTELLVRVHPDLVEQVEACCTERQSKDRRRLNLAVAGDETLALGDAQIEWDEGGLSLDAQARLAEVREELESLLPGAMSADDKEGEMIAD